MPYERALRPSKRRHSYESYHIDYQYESIYISFHFFSKHLNTTQCKLLINVV